MYFSWNIFSMVSGVAVKLFIFIPHAHGRRNMALRFQRALPSTFNPGNELLKRGANERLNVCFTVKSRFSSATPCENYLAADSFSHKRPVRVMCMHGSMKRLNVTVSPFANWLKPAKP
jgi:hypothetical protein